MAWKTQIFWNIKIALDWGDQVHISHKTPQLNQNKFCPRNMIFNIVNPSLFIMQLLPLYRNRNISLSPPPPPPLSLSCISRGRIFIHLKNRLYRIDFGMTYSYRNQPYVIDLNATIGIILTENSATASTAV